MEEDGVKVRVPNPFVPRATMPGPLMQLLLGCREEAEKEGLVEARLQLLRGVRKASRTALWVALRQKTEPVACIHKELRLLPLLRRLAIESAEKEKKGERQGKSDVVESDLFRHPGICLGICA